MSNIPILFIFSLILISTNALPIGLKNEELPKIVVADISENVTNDERTENDTVSDIKVSDRALARASVRPGMVVQSYAVQLEPNEANGVFSGSVVIVVNIIDAATREDDILFHISDLDVTSVVFAVGGGTNFMEANFFEDDGLLVIQTGVMATLYSFVIEFNGNLDPGFGLYSGSYAGANNYLAMNLHPTYARRVFPCIDELTEASTISFAINGVDYPVILSNSLPEENNPNQFRPLQGPPHLWGMIAHNYNPINTPIAGVSLIARPGVTSQDRASVAINSFMTWLNEWTQKNYFEIVVNQAATMNVIAIPDVANSWYSLSIVGIWEPYVLMPITHSVMQRKIGLVAIAEAMSRQWFGYVLYPENWIHNWVLTGIGTYAAYEAVKDLETNPNGEDDTLLDVDTMFVADVIQESLLRDGYTTTALVLQPDELIIEEDDVRQKIYGLIEYKAPAIMSMLRLVLSNADTDFIQVAARGLFISRSLQTVNTLNFIDAINSQWASHPDRIIGDIEEFLEPYITSPGYPVVRVHITQGGLTLNQQHFQFNTPAVPQTFQIPLTFTRSIDRNFDNVHPFMILDVATFSHNIEIGGEEDWVIYNIQGRGYYRVWYDNDLMERLQMALEDPERREEIHPLNRATLIDDSLNLARGGLLGYDLALQLVLTMEHETNYAVWRAFIRNMEFIQKRLLAMVADDEDLDPDIYLRLVRRTIGAIENELGFKPDLTEPAMDSLTRGIVMDHACRAGYDPCIAAAVDWFYDPNAAEPTVNPNIPHDIRPAVFCTMVKEGGNEVIDALRARLEIETTMYERLVILESFGCSQDGGFINGLLAETVAANSPYSVEERVRIFKAVVTSSQDNAFNALQFIIQNTGAIRQRYGGEKKLEEVIFVLAENMVDPGLATDYQTWVFGQLNSLGSSEAVAQRFNQLVQENLQWDNRYRDFVYEWIDENDATTAALSMLLVCITVVLTLFNH
ncbi:membrane alanyl aminopeptidase-like [Ostrinia nubilalis]|uniref:membrane alanyl aminopeptidase-like n=1 Tax=Ostrinia nubilalis TaxID=29057 RepID=UPI003082449A